MNMRFVETFVWLAKLRNFRLTAEKLHNTQAAVSSRIATLEQELGVRLFDRGDREVTLTLEGGKALVYAERLVRTMHEMLGSLKDRALYTGVIRIGVIDEFERSYIERMLAAHGGNVTHAAHAAKKNRRAFFELIRKHKIAAERFRPRT